MTDRRQPDMHDPVRLLVATYDVTGLSDDEVNTLAGEVEAQADRSKPMFEDEVGHPSVPVTVRITPSSFSLADFDLEAPVAIKGGDFAAWMAANDAHWLVTDLQSVEPDALGDVPGVLVWLDDEKDSMGFDRASVAAPSREALVEYVRDNWGDDDPQWFQEWVLDRIERVDPETRESEKAYDLASSDCVVGLSMRQVAAVLARLEVAAEDPFDPSTDADAEEASRILRDALKGARLSEEWSS